MRQPQYLPRPEPLKHDRRRVALEDVEMLFQHLREGPVGDALAVRKAPSGTPQRLWRTVAKAVPELAQEPRLADARIAEDRHELRLLPTLDLFVNALEQPHLLVAAEHRILQGVRAVEDPELMRELANSPVCLDVCPTSNVRLGVVASIGAHPLPALLAAGVRCSVNADDPLLFGPGLLEEYALCRSALGLTDDELVSVARASLEASGAPKHLVVEGLGAVDARLRIRKSNSIPGAHHAS